MGETNPVVIDQRRGLGLLLFVRQPSVAAAIIARSLAGKVELGHTDRKMKLGELVKCVLQRRPVERIAVQVPLNADPSNRHPLVEKPPNGPGSR